MDSLREGLSNDVYFLGNGFHGCAAVRNFLKSRIEHPKKYGQRILHHWFSFWLLHLVVILLTIFGISLTYMYMGPAHFVEVHFVIPTSWCPLRGRDASWWTLRGWTVRVRDTSCDPVRGWTFRGRDTSWTTIFEIFWMNYGWWKFFTME